MKLILFLITSFVYSNNLQFVTEPNGIKVFKDIELKKEFFIGYKESFEFFEDNKKNQNLIFIKFKNEDFYVLKEEFKNESWKKITNFHFAYKKYFYSPKKISIYEKPFLDSKTENFLDEWKIFQYDRYDDTWIKLKLNEKDYFVLRELVETFDNEEVAKTSLKLKEIHFKDYLVLIERDISLFEKEKNGLRKFKNLKKGLYRFNSEITVKEKKFFEIYDNKTSGYIEDENFKKFSYFEFKKYSFENSKWKNDSILKKVFLDSISLEHKERFLDFRSLNKKETYLTKDRKLIEIEYENDCKFRFCEYYKKDKLVLITKKNEIEYNQTPHEGKILIQDIDGDKIPELILSDFIARFGSSYQVLIKFSNSGKILTRNFSTERYEDRESDQIYLAKFDKNFILAENDKNEKSIQIKFMIQNEKLYLISENKKNLIPWNE